MLASTDTPSIVSSKPIQARDSIVTQLLTSVFGLYIFLTITISVIHLWVEFRETSNNVKQELKIKAEIFKSSLTEALWSYDEEQLESICIGIVKDPTIKKIKITREDKKVYTYEQSFTDKKDKSKESINQIGLFNNFQLEPFSYDLYYTSGNKNFFLGSVSLFPRFEIIFSRMKHTLIIVLSSALIKTLCFWLLFWWISNKVLRRPLKIMTDNLKELNPDLSNAKDVDLRLNNRNNELKLLEKTYNELLYKLRLAKHEITERDEKLEAQNQELEKKVIVRTREIQSTVLLKDALLKTLCHDLSNPLKGIVSWIKMIRGGEVSEGKEQREMIYSSIESCWSILSGVNTQRRSISLEDMDVRYCYLYECIQQSLLPLQAEILKKEIKIAIDVDKDILIEVDQNHFSYSILCNIFHNAIKFSSNRTCVQICSSIDENKNTLSIAIKDEGKGLKSEGYSSEEMMQANAELQTSTDGEKGSGTGLQQVAFFCSLFHFSVELKRRPESKGTLVKLITSNFKKVSCEE